MRNARNLTQPPGGESRAARWRRALTGRAAACALLAAFWVAMVASLASKSLTYDEVAHAAAGYSYWRYGDYRLQPENGQLPQRVAGIPMALSAPALPAPDPAAWTEAGQWQLGNQWLYHSGLDASSLGARGRMCCGLFAVGLGAVVWSWSRRLFGPDAGMLSLILYVLSPTVLANGALMTSDMAAALFFAAAVGTFWAVLSRLTLGRVVLCGVVLAALFLTKVSAVLVLPMAGALALVRLADGRPLDLQLGAARRTLASRGAQALAIAAAALVQAVIVVIVLWAAYGFRYSAFSEAGGRFRLPWEYLLAKPEPGQALGALGLSGPQAERAAAILASSGAVEGRWSNQAVDAVAAIRSEVLNPAQGEALDAELSRPSRALWVRAVELARRRRLLPEAWLYGFTDVFRRSQVRPAFLNGDFRLQGWRAFFPYTFAVKTPLAVFGVAALAAAAALLASGGGPLWRRFYPTAPLWVLLASYWAAAVASHLNIGHRHLLPTYGPMFILCGCAAAWFDGALSRIGGGIFGLLLAALLAVLAVGAAAFFPDYLAYFNGVVAPGQAYRHLVDSSLDWGQDLPAVRRYLDHHPKGEGPFYLSYFGTASPSFYGIRARSLYSVAGLDEAERPDWKTLFLPAGQAGPALPELRRQWPEHEVLGVQTLGGTDAVILLKRAESLRLTAGTYLISASMLQPVNFGLSGPWGPWNEGFEETYRGLLADVSPLMSDDRRERISAVMRHTGGEWPGLLERFEEFRFARLTAFLRQREPDSELGYSVLVYRLSESDVARAVGGAPPEEGPDERARELRLLPQGGPD